MTNYPQKPDDRDDDYEYKSMRDSGYYLLMDEITQESCADTIRWVLEESLSKKKKKHLNLVISSGGGDLSSAFALVDIIKGAKIPVHTTGIGVVGSAALVIFLAGARRVLTPNTSVLSHQFSWGADGKEHELFAVMKEFTLTKNRMLNHYRKCTGLKDSEIKKYLLPPEDVWLGADEALKLHICDEIKEMY
jgi:ATP-dependent Clp protease protease subunit